MSVLCIPKVALISKEFIISIFMCFSENSDFFPIVPVELDTISKIFFFENDGLN